MFSLRKKRSSQFLERQRSGLQSLVASGLTGIPKTPTAFSRSQTLRGLGTAAIARVIAPVSGGYTWLQGWGTRHENQLQAQALERRHRIAEGMHDVMAALNSDRPLSYVLKLIATHSQELLGASAAAIVTVDAACETWCVQARSDGAAAGRDLISELPYSAAAQAIATGTSLTYPDTSGATSQPRGSHDPAARRDASLVVPIVVEAAAFHGCLLLVYDERSSMTQANAELATLFAGQAVLAIENAQLKAMAQEMATRDERHRVARELHDSVTQSLYGIILSADATLLALHAGKADKAEERLYQLKDAAREAMTELRLLIYKLRPAILEEEGLEAALVERLQAVEIRSGIEVEMDLNGGLTSSLEVQQELFWVILEGLNNIVKHARAKHVRLTIVELADRCRLTLADDGVGFDVSTATRYGGYGLKTIGERLEVVGGTLSIRSERGAGTVLEIEVPL